MGNYSFVGSMFSLFPCLKPSGRMAVLLRCAMYCYSAKHKGGCIHRALGAVASYIECLYPNEEFRNAIAFFLLCVNTAWVNELHYGICLNS